MEPSWFEAFDEKNSSIPSDSCLAEWIFRLRPSHIVLNNSPLSRYIRATTIGASVNPPELGYRPNVMRGSCAAIAVTAWVYVLRLTEPFLYVDLRVVDNALYQSSSLAISPTRTTIKHFESLPGITVGPHFEGLIVVANCLRRYSRACDLSTRKSVGDNRSVTWLSTTAAR